MKMILTWGLMGLSWTVFCSRLGQFGLAVWWLNHILWYIKTLIFSCSHKDLLNMFDIYDWVGWQQVCSLTFFLSCPSRPTFFQFLKLFLSRLASSQLLISKLATQPRPSVGCCHSWQKLARSSGCLPNSPLASLYCIWFSASPVGQSRKPVTGGFLLWTPLSWPTKT